MAAEKSALGQPEQLAQIQSLFKNNLPKYCYQLIPGTNRIRFVYFDGLFVQNQSLKSTTQNGIYLEKVSNEKLRRLS